MGVRAGYKQTEVGVIPEDWEVKPLGEIGESLIGLTYRPSDVRESGTLVLRASNIRQGKLCFDDNVFVSVQIPAKLMVRAADILICARNGSRDLIGKCTQIDERAEGMTFGAFMAVFRTQSGGFVYQQISSYLVRRQIREHLGATINQITNKSLNSFLVPLPPTYAEQRIIADILTDADALIESLEQLLAKKRQLKQGAMQELLSGRRRLPGFECSRGFKLTDEGTFPRDWQRWPFEAVVRIASGQVDPLTEPYRSMTLVGPDHIESGSGRLLKLETANDQRAISGKYLFAAGDIVYGKIRPNLRKAILAEFSGLCSADMYPIRPAVHVSSGFIFATILGERFSRFAESVSARSGMPKINRDELAQFVFVLPPTKVEQTAIAAVLSDMDAEIAALEAKLTKARQLKQGMMQQLLTGKIRLV